MSLNSADLIRFGDFELDVGRSLLRSAAGHETISLTPKALDILVYLIERRGQVVDKSELMDSIWPNVVVEENNLTQAISALRRALGEKPREHRYIATVPGRGYRFVANVGDAQKQSTPRSQPALRPAHIVGIALLAVVVGVFIYSMVPDDSGPTSDNRPVVTSLAPISQSPANLRQPTLSRDGSMVAFVSDESGSDQIWVKTIASGEARQLTDFEGGAGHPAWAADGSGRIYFHEATNGGIWWMDALGTGNSRRILTEGRNPSFPRHGSEFGGTIVYQHEGDILLANADGSNPRSVPGLPSRTLRFYNLDAELSPDGQQIAVFLQNDGPRGDIWIIPVTGGNPLQLTNDFSEGGSPSWSSDGRYIYFSSSRIGTRTLWRVPAEGGEPVPVVSGVGEYLDFALSTDDTRIVFTNARPLTRFVRWDPDSNQSTIILETRYKSSFPAVSPDGERVVYFAKSDEIEQIWLMDAQGESPPVELTSPAPGYIHIMPSWSQVEDRVYFYETGPNWSLYSIALDGTPSDEVFAEFSWFGYMDVAFSPEGDRIVYIEMETEDPQNFLTGQAVIRELESGVTTELPPDIIFAPSWSRDGRFVLGTSPDGVAICPADGGECEIIVEHDPVIDREGESPTLGHLARFSWDQTRVFFTRRTEDPLELELWVVNRDGTNERALVRYGPVDPLGGRFQVFPDDDILWDEYGTLGPAELWLATFTETGN